LIGGVDAARARLSGIARRPALAILLIAPFCGEALSGATPPLQLVLPWKLAFLAALCGSGALVCREVARRFRLGLPGLCLLGAGYGVYEEALVDWYSFYPKFWHDADVGTYSEFWHTKVLLAVHLTAFHAAVSICSSVLIVERLFPAGREQAWAGGRGLSVLAFACTAAHFVLVYALPSTDVPWPLGVLLSLAPIGIGILLICRIASGGPYCTDGLRAVTGILVLFVLLDVVVGLGGRYDMFVGATATAIALRWLRNRDRRQSASTTVPPPRG
jgi:hypothetical protein